MKTFPKSVSLPATSIAMPDHDLSASLFAEPSRLNNARILVVDDEPDILNVVTTTLTRLEAKVTPVNSVAAALEMLATHEFDCIVSDHCMPGQTGLDLLTQVRQQDRTVGIVMVTAAGELPVARQAMRQGCDDFLVKPFGLRDLRLSVELALEKRAYRTSLHEDRDRFQQLALEKAERLQGTLECLDRALDAERMAHRQTILVLAQAAESSERDMGRHIHRVAAYTAILGRALGYSDTDADFLGLSATLHDVGKIAVPAELLTRKGPLSREEFAIVKEHTVAGGRILKGVNFLKEAHDIALAHHERWDGTGYPNQLDGESIPLSARIASLTDVWDALISRRSYKDAWPIERCLDYVARERGLHFDPAVVDAFFASQAEFDDVRETLGDNVQGIIDGSKYDLLRPSPPVRKSTPAVEGLLKNPGRWAPQTPLN